MSFKAIATAFNALLRALFGSPTRTVLMPIVQPVSRDVCRVIAPWRVTVVIDGWRIAITVDPPFEFDGASVPRLFWFAAGHPLEAPRVAAALAHDYLYRTHAFDRRMADRIYARIQAMSGRAPWRILVEYLALRFCGEAAWRSHGADARDTARRQGEISVTSTSESL